jgi:hypothetical protein
MLAAMAIAALVAQTPLVTQSPADAAPPGTQAAGAHLPAASAGGEAAVASEAAPAPAPEGGTSATDAPPTPIAFPLVRVEMQSSPRGLQYYWKASPEQVRARGAVHFPTGRFAVVQGDPLRFVDLCEAPCEARLPRGRLDLGFSTDFGRSMTSKVFDVTAPTLLEGTFVSRRYVRIAGILTMVAGATAALVLGLSSESECDSLLKPGDAHEWKCRTYRPGLKAGLITAGVSVLIGTPLLFVPDRLSFEARPAPPRH